MWNRLKGWAMGPMIAAVWSPPFSNRRQHLSGTVARGTARGSRTTKAAGQLLVLAALASSAAVQADTLQAEPYDPNYLYGVMLGDLSGTVYSMPFTVHNLTEAKTFLAFCVEPFQELSSEIVESGDASYGPAPYSKTSVQALYDGYFGNALSSAQESAAFQFALWELVVDNDANLSAGKFSLVPDPAVTRAQQMLDGIGASSDRFILTAWLSPTSQDLVQASTVPEPGNCALMLAGLAVLAGSVEFRARRRQRRSRTGTVPQHLRVAAQEHAMNKPSAQVALHLA